MEQEIDEENRKKFLEHLERIKRTSLSIRRIPEQTKTEFLELAKSEFSDDYGMTLKWLLDYRKGLLSSPNEELNIKIDVLADEINKINQRISIFEQKPSEEKILKAADGREIRIGGNRQNGNRKQIEGKRN